MPTANIVPTYYRVTWTGTSVSAGPDYNALTGNQAGGLDDTLPEKYNRIIRLAGTDSSVSVTAGQSIYINNVKVTFTVSPSLLADVVTAINLLTTEHGVIAYEYATNYLGLQNAWNKIGEPIWVAAGDTGTALTDMGLTPGVWSYWPNQFGGTFTSPDNNADTIKINGITISLASGDSAATVVGKINAQTGLTSVAARLAGAGIQLASTVGQPFMLTDGTGYTAANLGASFVAGAQGGTPTTLAQSLNKERANQRWEAVVFELGWLISPIFLGEIVKTGTTDGTAPVETLAFTVGYDRAAYLSTEDELNAGVMLTGADCIKRLIARALVQSYTSNQEIFDPTITTVGNTCARLNPSQIMQLTAEAIDAPADIATVEANITVTQIANV